MPPEIEINVLMMTLQLDYEFSVGWPKIHNKQKNNRPSLTPDNLHTTEDTICADR